MIHPSEPDRRAHARYPLDRWCKLGRPGSTRYAPGQIVDISRSGICVELRPSAQGSLSPGERIELIVDWESRGVLADPPRTRGLVVRRSVHPEQAGSTLHAPHLHGTPPTNEAGPTTPDRLAIAFDRLIELRPDIIGAQIRSDHWSRSA